MPVLEKPPAGDNEKSTEEKVWTIILTEEDQKLSTTVVVKYE